MQSIKSFLGGCFLAFVRSFSVCNSGNRAYSFTLAESRHAVRALLNPLLDREARTTPAETSLSAILTLPSANKAFLRGIPANENVSGKTFELSQFTGGEQIAVGSITDSEEGDLEKMISFKTPNFF